LRQASKPSQPSDFVAKLIKEWKAGERTQSSVVDALVEKGHTVAEISRLVDRPYRQVFNTVNRKRYGLRPSERQ